VKLIKIAGLALVGLVLVAVLVLVFGIPGQPLMGYIEEQAAKAGYQLRVDGASKVSLWPNLNVSASDIRLSDPDDPRDNLLTAKELRIGISLLSLLTGDVRIHEIEVTRPVVRLTSGRRGSRVAGRRETREDSARNIAIDRLSVVDGTLIMRDLRENLEGRLDAIQLTASAPADGPVDLKLDGKAGDQLLRLAAKANSLRQIIDGRPTPVEATIELPGVVKGPLSLTANFRATDRVIGIDGIRGQLSSGRVSGAVAIDTSGAKPAANANLNFDRVELLPAPASRQASRDEPWSNKPMDLAALRVFDMAVKISARELVVDTIRIAPAEIEANLSGGLLSLAVTRSDLYGGPAQGRLVVDAASRDARYGLTLEFARANAQQFLTDAFQFDHIDGRFNGKFDLTASGLSPRAIVASLGGTADLSFEDGSIRGLNIPSMVNILSSKTMQGWQEKESERTEFGSFFAKFQITDGKATSDDIRLVGPLVRMTGKGTADLVARTLDFRVDPKLVLSQQGQGSANDPAGLGVPVVIRGSFDNPQIYPDISGILDNPEAAFSKLKQMGGSLFGLLGTPESTGTPGSGKKPNADEVIKSLDQLFRGDRGDRGDRRNHPPDNRNQVRDLLRDLLGR
jgi:AsmA protein